MVFPPVPASIKSIAHVLKIADEHEGRNIVVAYWARLYACQSAMKLIPGKKPPEVTNLLVALMEWLENTKHSKQDVEGINNETVAHALIEDYAMKLFSYADQQDRAGNFDKNMIKAFYTAGILMDILEQFGDQTEDVLNKKKYAKWKAAYIHNCLKTGDIPTSGGPNDHLKNVIDISKDSDDDTQHDLVIPPRNQDATPQPDYRGPAPAPSPVTPGLPPQQPNFPINPTEPAFPITPVAPSQPSQPPLINIPAAPATSNAVNPERIQQAQKFCKYASSALNYDDVKTAIENLTKALNTLQQP